MTLQPGQVRDSIIGYLTRKGVDGAHLKEIHAAVEKKLGHPVSSSSVRSYLNLNVGTRFTRVGRGTYRMSNV